MTRASYYVSKDAAAALDSAVVQVLAVLGGDIPKHVALSALIAAGAARADDVAAELANARAAQLAERIQALRQAGERPPT